VPPEPVAVPVYVVVTIGDVVAEPLATGVTEPTPLSMEKEAAFEVVQESVAVSPGAMDDGLAESEHMGAAGGGGDITCWFLKTTAAQTGPTGTSTFPSAGVTDRSFQVLPAGTSVT